MHIYSTVFVHGIGIYVYMLVITFYTLESHLAWHCFMFLHTMAAPDYSFLIESNNIILLLDQTGKSSCSIKISVVIGNYCIKILINVFFCIIVLYSTILLELMV